MAVQKEFRIPGSMIVTGTANVGSLNIVSGDLNITGGLTTTANVTVGGTSLSTKAINANGVLTISTGATSATPAINATAGTGGVYIIPSSTSGNFNSLVTANDVVLVGHFGASNTGNLVLGTWSSRAGGLGVKIRSLTNDILFAADTITFGTAGLSVNGSIGTSGQVLYSNGTNSYWGAQVALGVTSVASANGLSGGTIISTGTLYAVGANAISVTAAGINVLAGNNQLIANTSGLFLDQTKINLTLLSNYNANQHIDHTAVSITAGNGLTGGGTIDTTRILAVTAGNNQIIANTTGVFIDQTKIDHNLLTNYSANQHVDHTSVSITAGTGLTGGGTIATSRTLNLDTSYVAGLTVNNSFYLGGQPGSYYTDIITRLGYTPVKQGTGTGQGSNTVNIGWGTTGDGIKLQVDATNYANVWPMSITGVAGAVANTITAGSGLSGTTYNGNAAVTWTLATAFGDTINPYASKTANLFLASPNGAPGVPGFRAIVGADVPTLNQSTTGSAGSVVNSLTAGSGLSGSVFNGAAAVTWTLATAFGDTINPYASKTANFVLAAPNGSAGAPVFRAIVAADIPTLNQSTTGAAGSVTGITLQAGLGTSSTPTFATVLVTGTSNTVILNATGNTQIQSLGVGTTATGTTGQIRATNDITAFFSDRRLKDIHGPIDSALDKVNSLHGIYFNANETAASYGYDTSKRQVGVVAQEVFDILPEVTDLAPFDTKVVNGIMQSISGENYLTVQYEKLVPLLIEAIKELSAEVTLLKANR